MSTSPGRLFLLSLLTRHGRTNPSLEDPLSPIQDTIAHLPPLARLDLQTKTSHGTPRPASTHAVKHYEAFNKLGPSAPLRSWLTTPVLGVILRKSGRALSLCSAPSDEHRSCRRFLSSGFPLSRLPRIWAVSQVTALRLHMHEHRVDRQGSSAQAR